MKLNCKGMTLIELLVAVVFVGMVLALMFALLNGLRNETDNNNFAYNNQVNKIDAIHTVQKDLNNYSLIGIKNQSDSDININLYYLKGIDTKIAKLFVSHKNNKNYLNYENVDGEKFSWEMKSATIDTCGKFTIFKENNTYEDEDLNSYYFKLVLNVYNSTYNEQNNKDNNNVVDDIEITYSDYKYNLEDNSSYLTSKNNGTYNIGNCAN